MNYRFQREYDEIMNTIQQHNKTIDGLNTNAIDNTSDKKFKVTPSIEQKQNYQVSNLNYNIKAKQSEAYKKDQSKSKYYNSIDDVIQLDKGPKKWSEIDLYYKKKHLLDYLRILQIQYSISENEIIQIKTIVYNAIQNKELCRNSDVDFDIEQQKINKIDRIEYSNGTLIYKSLKKKKSTVQERGQYKQKTYLKKRLEKYNKAYG
jgi:hypothetical protein